MVIILSKRTTQNLVFNNDKFIITSSGLSRIHIFSLNIVFYAYLNFVSVQIVHKYLILMSDPFGVHIMMVMTVLPLVATAVPMLIFI